MRKHHAKACYVLLVHPDREHGAHVQEVLRKSDIHVTWVQRHLSGLALVDERSFSAILAAVEGHDLDGLEFSALLRRRQQLRQTPGSIVILLGQDRHRELLAATPPEMNDYLIEPCLDAEIVWRVRRNVLSLEMNRSQGQGGSDYHLARQESVFSRQSLLAALQQEINRSSRGGASFGLVLIKVKGWSLLAKDYGPDGARIVEDILVHRMQRLVRTYDRFFRIDRGRFVVLLPQAGRDGVVGFVHRLQSSLTETLRAEAVAGDELQPVHMEGVCTLIDAHYIPPPGSIDDLYTYVVDKVLSDASGPELVFVRIGANGVLAAEDQKHTTSI